MTSNKLALGLAAGVPALALADSAYAAGSDVIRVGMIGCGGRCTEAATNAMRADPGVRLVAMAESGEEPAAYLGAGVQGVVYGSVRAPVLLEGARKVAKGGTCLQDRGAPAEMSETDMVAVRVRDRLTPKELRIVALIVQGYKNKDIATELGTTEQVIKNYLRNIYDKIGVSDRLELALFTIHHRILAEAAAASVRH